VIDESQGILIAQILLDRGFDIVAYDPVAMETARNVFADRIKYAPSAQNCILDVDAVLIATPWEEFKQLEYAPLNGSKDPIVIDCWGMLGEKTLSSTRVLRLGKNLSVKLNDQTFPQELRLRTGWDNELER
jgi:UDPglucose 6-dehydrogenase